MKDATKSPESESLELVNRQPQEVARIEDNPLAFIGAMLQSSLKGGITEANVAVAEKMLGLIERLNDKKAEQEFNAAFVALQRDMPKIVANKPVPNNDGTIRYVFAPFEEIMGALSPVLMRHGFTVSFSQRFADARVYQKCTIRHTSGHSVSNEFGARIGKGPPGSSEAQGDGAASTYAKRFALCDAFNIVIEKDNDARNVGEPIGEAAGTAFYRRLQALKADEAAFLGLAGVPPLPDTATEQDVLAAFASIPNTALANLEELLAKAERVRKPK